MRRLLPVPVVAALVAVGAGCGGDAAAGLDEVDLDARDTCSAVNRLPEAYDDLPADLPGFDDPEFWRIQAVQALAQGAAAGDPTYRRLGEAGEALGRTVQRFDGDAINDALAELHAACADLFDTDS